MDAMDSRSHESPLSNAALGQPMSVMNNVVVRVGMLNFVIASVDKS
jgi:hypothetical protein